MACLSALATEIVIPVCAFVGIAYSYYLVRWFPEWHNSNSLDDEEQDITRHKVECNRMMQVVSKGAKAFLFMEYRYGGVFIVAFAILIFLCLGSVESFSTQSRPCRFDPSKTCKPALATAVFSAVSFLLGAFTSVLSGFLGVQITIYANARTVLRERDVVGKKFFTDFRSGAVMGFLLAANGLLVLYVAINLFKLYYGNDWEGLFEAIAGYGLGASFMALFGRAARGIYAKAADICTDPFKGTEIYPQSPQNAAVISYCVGEIVGDIAGMGTDLFGSYADSTCAALVVASISSFGNDHDFTAICYPLLISSMGILVCLITNLFTTRYSKLVDFYGEPASREQLIISTILMTVAIAIVSWIALPSTFTVYHFGSQKVVKNWQLGLCVGVGLCAGLIIRLVRKYFTKEASSFILDAAADNVNAGLASVNIPFFAAICIFVGSSFAATYGIAVAALGMLSTIATGFAINAYGPISHNSEVVSQLATHGHFGYIIATRGKEFAIESAALVSIALFGAFVSRVAISPANVPTPKFFISLIVGGLLPYKFSAMTMKSVGTIALKMARHLDDDRIVEISTDAAIREMIPPFTLVMLTPLIVGTFFGVEMLSGVLAGSLTSVVKIAISAPNTHGEWEKVQKYVEAGALECMKSAKRNHMSPLEKKLIKLYSDGKFPRNLQKNALTPALNILIQLMVVESLVFAPFYATHGGLLFKIF